jgi:uncharacterized membrane protein
MHWSGFVVIGAVLNALVNLGYKVSAAKDGIFLMAAAVMFFASCTMIGISHFSKENIKLSNLLLGWTPFIIVGMGIGTGSVMLFFIKAMSKGPYSLVDPMWACIYALSSVAIGMVLLKEGPSMTALVGIGLYLVGAYLMSRG